MLPGLLSCCLLFDTQSEFFFPKGTIVPMINGSSIITFDNLTADNSRLWVKVNIVYLSLTSQATVPAECAPVVYTLFTSSPAGTSSKNAPLSAGAISGIVLAAIVPIGTLM